MRTILCYGDSNTWGSDPGGGPRLDENTRWTGVLRQILGPGFTVIEEGLGGRTTVWDDPIEDHRNGKRYLLPCLHSHKPLDLVVLMLGTNDLKHRFGLSAFDIALGAGTLVAMIRASGTGPDGGSPQVLLVAPPPVFDPLPAKFAGQFWGAEETSRQLGAAFRHQAEQCGCAFLDAGSVIASSRLDGIHLEPSEHHKLAVAATRMVQGLLGGS